MTQDEIIEMAREAGLYQDINVSFHQALRNFYNLATAKEREACAKLCEEYASANTSWTKAAVKDCAAIIRARGEQEPVAHPFKDASVISALAWAAGLIQKEYPAGHNGADSWLMNYADVQGERIRLADHRKWEKVHGRWQPKTIAPPQRTWVGLFDEEIWQIATDCTIGGDLHADKFARAIESKLKEVNT